jgi:excisionase family DNA binding protein
MSGSNDQAKNGNKSFPVPAVSKHPGLKSKFNSSQERSMAIDPLLTINDLCSLLKIEPTTVYQMTYRGKIPHYKIANRLRFRQSEILAWIDNQRVNKASQFGQGD